jgi:hypothetical protein
MSLRYRLVRVRDAQGDSVQVRWPDPTRGTYPEYRLTPGQELREMALLRREIDAHLAEPRGTLGNYQW